MSKATIHAYVPQEVKDVAVETAATLGVSLTALLVWMLANAEYLTDVYPKEIEKMRKYDAVKRLRGNPILADEVWGDLDLKISGFCSECCVD